VKSVETVNVTVAGAGSGVINIVLLRTLVYMPFGAFSGPGNNLGTVERTWPYPYLHPTRVYDGATLQVIRAGSSSNSRVEGFVTVVEAP